MIFGFVIVYFLELIGTLSFIILRTVSSELQFSPIVKTLLTERRKWGSESQHILHANPVSTREGACKEEQVLDWQWLREKTGFEIWNVSKIAHKQIFFCISDLILEAEEFLLEEIILLKGMLTDNSVITVPVIFFF